MTITSTRRSAPLLTVSLAFVALWVLIAAFPFLWTAWGSFKVESDFFSRTDWMNAVRSPVTQRIHGSHFTLEGYEGAWIEREFWKSAINTGIVCLFVTTISLTFGTLGGYALSRSSHRYTFWLLMLALVFRAMPHITLVSGYLLPFFQLNVWGILPTAIIVMIAMNQPFTLWMLYSFFKSIPTDLDESALVDGCSRFQAFRLAVMPVMWPGVVTAGLFSFMMGYNDFTVTTLLLSADNQTMIPKIASFLGSTQEPGKIMYAVAAVTSSIVPIFVLVMLFQRRIVSGLTAGAVKG